MDRSDKKGNKRKRIQGRGWGGGREKQRERAKYKMRKGRRDNERMRALRHSVEEK